MSHSVARCLGILATSAALASVRLAIAATRPVCDCWVAGMTCRIAMSAVPNTPHLSFSLHAIQPLLVEDSGLPYVRWEEVRSRRYRCGLPEQL